MGGAAQVAMRVASQIWQVVFVLQTLQVFCLALRKKAQYVVVLMKDHQKMFFTQILIEVEVEWVKPHFNVNTKARMLDIINMKVNLMEVDEETLEEEEVVEVTVEVIEINNQIATQITTIARNLSTCQRIVIKGNMMHEMESYNKGIMHQLAIKVMNNYL